MNPKDFLKLREQVEALQREADRAEGALQQVKEKLKEEFGVASIREAKQLLAKLRQEEKELTLKLEAADKSFQRKWGSKLGDAQ